MEEREKAVQTNLKLNELQRLNSQLQFENDRYKRRNGEHERRSRSQPDLNNLLDKVQILRSEAGTEGSINQNAREAIKGMDIYD